MTSKARKRDNNVEALYKAENSELPFGVKFKNLDEIQLFANLVTASPEWNALGNVPCHVRIFDWGENSYSEARDPNEIWLARKHWDTQVVLHELAHIAVPQARHSSRWVRTYLELLESFMGSHYERVYRAAFKRIGVRL